MIVTKAFRKMSVTKPDASPIGHTISAKVTKDQVTLLVERLYGITVLTIQELNGYDDKNYKITEDPNMKNPIIVEHSPNGYVLKIMNSVDSKNHKIIEAQNKVMDYLNKNGVVCPKPVSNINGQLFSIEEIGGKSHAVRLLGYVPGEILQDVPKSDSLFYQLGQFVANLVNKLQKFEHPCFETREHIWMLDKVPELHQFTFAVKDTDNLELAEEVIEEFKYAVVPRKEELEQGIIHGDINQHNVIVQKKPGSSSEWSISGIIDFGDTHHSCLVYELAIAMTYAILMTGDLTTAGLVLAGYSVNRRLPDHEYRLLKTLISARLVQSLVLGAYTLLQDPKNVYVVSTEKANGWGVLKRIRKSAINADELDPTDWKTIANKYLTRS